MFLRGIFGYQVQTNNLKRETLVSIDEHFSGKHLNKKIKDTMYELVTSAFERGIEFDNDIEMEKYAWGIGRNEKLTKIKKMIDHNEYALDDMPEDGTKMPYRTVNQGLLTSEDSLVEQPQIYWQTLISKDTFGAVELKETLEDWIETYNRVSDYLERTYGFSFKEVLNLAMSGVSESKDYLKEILELENDLEFKEAFNGLSQYAEFYDFIKSDEGVLSLW